MRVEAMDGGDTRKIITAMIVDPITLGRVAAHWQPGGMFADAWSNLVGGWCVSHYNKYKKAPAGDIESRFESWSSSGKCDKATVQLVSKFLTGLSGEYAQHAEAINSDYVIDLASKHFNKVRLARLRDQIDADLQEGDVDKADGRIHTANKIELANAGWSDFFRSPEKLRAALEAKSDSIVTYSGPLGRFINPALKAGGFLAFLAAEKRGKSYWLMDFAYRATLQRKRVAYFVLGDMNEDEVWQRMASRAARQPLYPTQPGKPILWPTAIERDKGERFAKVSHGEFEFDKGMRFREVQAVLDTLVKRKIKSNDSILRISVAVAGTMTAAGIRSELESYARSGWVPEIVVLDYIDVLAPHPGLKDLREQINFNWQYMRGVTQETGCLLVTATQADSASYGAYLLNRRNFSNDKRILAHCTAMAGINVTPTEKKLGVSRLNWIVGRAFNYSETKCVHVAGCLALSAPAVKSVW